MKSVLNPQRAHKVQGLSLEQGVTDFDLRKQKHVDQDKCILRSVG